MCTQNTLKQLLDQVCGYAKDLLGEKLTAIKLFGSYARGDYDDESDIDIMILADISPEERNQIRDAIFDFTYELNLQYDVLLSITIQDAENYMRYKDSYPFFRNIEREGVDLVA